MDTASFSLVPVVVEDVPILAKYSAEAFRADRQTQMKGFSKVPYDLEDVARTHMADFFADPAYLPRNRLIKAVDNATGAIMGHAWFGFKNFDPSDVPTLEAEIPPLTKFEAEPERVSEKLSVEQQKSTINSIRGDDTWRKFSSSDEEDPIKRLESLTGDDLMRWLHHFEPEGLKVIRVVGLTTAPGYQRRGVGSALLRFATSVADKMDVYCWVHSSEPAWGAYAKSGFKVVGTLDVDLDEFAPRPPPIEESSNGKWGHYVFRYMQYFPQKH
jgi:GNAT superfamily N-acetyltransferase